MICESVKSYFKQKQITVLPMVTCIFTCPQHTMYYDDIEEREDAGTPQIIQKIRAALAFWVKDYVGYELIGLKERSYVRRALERLVPNKNIKILGTTSQKRLAIMSFLIYTTSGSSLSDMLQHDASEDKKLYAWSKTGGRRGKVLHGPFVAKLLNDLFGIQARGGCSCAGPYGETLLGADEKYAADIKFALQKVINHLQLHFLCDYISIV